MTIARLHRITSVAASALVWAGLAVWLAACTPAQQARAVADGALFCAVATASGPLVVAMIDAASGGAVIVTGMTARAVAATCAIIAAIPVTPPANPAAAPVVAVALPAAKV